MAARDKKTKKPATTKSKAKPAKAKAKGKPAKVKPAKAKPAKAKPAKAKPAKVAKPATVAKPAAKPAKPTQPAPLRLPPLPELVWDDPRWRGTDRMPAWAGLRFFSKWMKRSAKPDDGTVNIALETRDASAPDAVQLATYAYLKRNERAIAKAVLARILADYPEARRAYTESVDDTWPVLPEVTDVAGLGAVIGPPTIHIHSNRNNEGEIGTIGFAFDCAWDEEHQLSVLTHGDEVLEIGDGSVAGHIFE